MTIAIGDCVARIHEVLPAVSRLDELLVEVAVGDETLSLNLSLSPSGVEPPRWPE
jgi:hypothetical protein